VTSRLARRYGGGGNEQQHGIMLPTIDVNVEKTSSSSSETACCASSSSSAEPFNLASAARSMRMPQRRASNDFDPILLEQDDHDNDVDPTKRERLHASKSNSSQQRRRRHHHHSLLKPNRSSSDRISSQRDSSPKAVRDILGEAIRELSHGGDMMQDAVHVRATAAASAAQ